MDNFGSSILYVAQVNNSFGLVLDTIFLLGSLSLKVSIDTTIVSPLFILFHSEFQDYFGVIVSLLKKPGEKKIITVISS